MEPPRYLRLLKERWKQRESKRSDQTVTSIESPLPHPTGNIRPHYDTAQPQTTLMPKDSCQSSSAKPVDGDVQMLKYCAPTVYDTPKPPIDDRPSPVKNSIPGGNQVHGPDRHKNEQSVRRRRELKPPVELWSDAYEELKRNEKTKYMIDTYEKILSNEKLQTMVGQKPRERSDPLDQDLFPNDFACLLPLERIKTMRRIAEQGLDKMEERGRSKVIVGVQQAINLIKKSKDFIGDALQSCPAASLAWAGVCLIVLPAIVNGIDQPAQKCKGLDYVIDRMKWYVGLHQLLLKENWKDVTKFIETCDFVEKKVCSLYTSLIEYQVTSVCTLFVNFAHKMFNSLKHILGVVDWTAKLNDIKDLERDLNADIAAHLNVEICDSLHDLVVSSSEQLGMLSRIHKSLKDLYAVERLEVEKKAKKRVQNQIAKFDGTGYRKAFDKIAELEQPTGNWLLKHREYEKWKLSETGLLVIEANPGRGKSVLAKSVVKELRDKHTVCHFFFTSDSNCVHTKTALRALLYQLFDQRNDMAEALRDLIEKRQEESLYETDVLWEIFESATRHCAQGEVICILDALDECDKRDAGDLLRRLSDKTLKTPMKFFITTRPNIRTIVGLETLRDPEGSRTRNFFDINLERDDGSLKSLSNDIDKVIDQKFNNFTKNHLIESPQLKRNLRVILKSYGEQRTYLWVDRVFEYLSRLPSPPTQQRWLGVFKNLSVDIHQTYIEFLKSVPGAYQEDVRRIFAMLAAAFEPLDVQNMGIAVNVDEPELDLRLEGSDYFRSWMLKYCGFLLEVFGGKIYFMHPTARDFLLSETAARPIWLLPFDTRAGHYELAKSCISYLRYVSSSLKTRNSDPCSDHNLQLPYSARDLKGYSFLKYSALYGLAHVREAKYMPKENQLLVKQMHLLSTYLEHHYNLTGRIENLKLALATAEIAVFVAVDYPDLIAESKKILGNYLGRRYERTGAIDDLNRAVELATVALRDTLLDHPDRPGRLENLGNQLGRRFERTGAIDDLNRAVKLTEEALRETPLDHPSQPGRSENLGNQFGRRFERTGAIDDLNRAVELATIALRETPLDHPDRPGRLENLGNQLSRRYMQTGDIEILNSAVDLAREALRNTPLDRPDRPGRLENLGNQLGRRFERTGAIDDLNRAVKLTEEALRETPLNHPDRPYRLEKLGNQLDRRYKRTGAVNDLAQAIELAEMAVITIPLGHPDRARLLNNLGSLFSSRYQRTGKMKDLEEGIERVREAIAITPSDHPDRVDRLDNLGNKLEGRYKRTGKIEDLEEAIDQAREALAAIPDAHPNRPGLLNNLGNKLAYQYERTGRLEDLEESIERAREALLVTPDDHPDRADRLNSLGNKLESQHKRIGNIKDLEEAIERAREAVAATPDDHPDQADRLKNLGNKLESRYVCLGTPKDETSALSLFVVAWKTRHAAPLHRLTAVATAIRILKSRQEWSRARQLAVESTQLLPVVINRLLSRQDQQYIVSKFSGLAVDACSLIMLQLTEVNQGFTRSHVAEEALQTLELGRGAISNLLIDDRSDTSELREKYPEAAHTFNSLKTQLISLMPETDNRKLSILRSALAKQLDQCINDIRRLPGQAHFLRPPSLVQMKEMAQDGAIVVVNISDIRSDAILITKSSIQALPLPHLHHIDVQTWSGGASEQLNVWDLGQRNIKYSQFLNWLWDVCVKPVLQYIGYCTNEKVDHLHRLWWIGTGIATSLPFHAAGNHSPASIENTFSCAISSYTPTLRALRYSKERARRMASVLTDQSRVLIVGMPTTPGLADLPGVTEEVSRIGKLLQEGAIVHCLAGPTVEEVLYQLEDHQIVHFACHSSSNVLDPSESCVILQRYQTSQADLVSEPLTVGKLAHLQLVQARIAFLSAGSTAEVIVGQLADEVIHLASGFQVAGFTHVIGSLWPSTDDICIEVAERFYRMLTTRNWNEIQDRDVALALHHSVLRVRSQGQNWKAPELWAQYVHLGA